MQNWFIPISSIFESNHRQLVPSETNSRSYKKSIFSTPSYHSFINALYNTLQHWNEPAGRVVVFLPWLSKSKDSKFFFYIAFEINLVLHPVTRSITAFFQMTAFSLSRPILVPNDSYNYIFLDSSLPVAFHCASRM